MEFLRGDEVEVLSNEEGFLGSYFGATIVSKNPDGSYVVRYKDLVTEENHSIRLQEVISAQEIRPKPPRIISTYFRLGDEVDALANDGWWVGVVTSRRGIHYSVYFATTDEEVEYPIFYLRMHLDWVEGYWYSSQ